MPPMTRPATSKNASNLRGGSRYGPTPAAPDGAADRQAPAPEACKETDRWRPTDDPGDHPVASPPTAADARIDSAGTRAVTLASLPEVLTVREAAKVLRVGRNQLYQAVERGQLRAVRIGRSIRIPKQALLDLLARNTPLTGGGDE
jgi:excisionase family DNA binding protein